MIKVAGKLYILGEYAVVEPNHSAIIASVDRFIFFEIEKSDRGIILDKIEIGWDYSDDINFDSNDIHFDGVKMAFKVVFEYIKELGYEIPPFKLVIDSKLSENGIKYGLGSSGAVQVGVIRSILEFFNVDYTKMDLFKLASVSSILTGSNGSCGDIASCVYSGVIFYRSFSREYIKKMLEIKTVYEVVSSEWEFLEISELRINNNFKFSVCWSKSPAISDNLVNKANILDKNSEFYKNFLKKSEQYVLEFKDSYLADDFNKLSEVIRKSRKNLNEFAEKSGILLEVDIHKNFCDMAERIGACAKTSGAGNGDCAIAFSKKQIDFSCKLNMKIWREYE